MTHPLEQVECFLCIFLVAGSQCIFRHGDGGEAFRKHISSFPEWGTVGHDFEIHSSVRIETVIFNEIQRQFGCFQPFRILFHMIVGKRADKGKTALEPYRLGGVEQLSVACHAGIYTSVFLVETIFQPERHDVVGEIFFVVLSPVLCVGIYAHHKADD
ncbi:uncharacterized protein BN800_00771 [Bacteroides sp. CAG:875]|nr:uncharacterized protein BN800_00771 [Bacteroides sp. CAG:875]